MVEFLFLRSASAFAFHYVYQVEDDPVFQPQNEVQVAETDIGVDEHHGVPLGGQTGPDVRGGGGLPNASFSRCDDYNFAHIIALSH